MTKVYQEGNTCLAACIATLLNIPLESCSFVCSSEDWEHDNVKPVLDKLGYSLVLLPLIGDTPSLHYLPEGMLLIAIAELPSTEGTGISHAVIGRIKHRENDEDNNRVYDLEVVHDPSGVAKKYIRFAHLGFLVPHAIHKEGGV